MAQASRRSRITTPMRGLGAKDVDLRGIRTPRAAVAITSATVGGCTATTMPGLAGRGVQRLVEAVVVADLLLGHPPGGQQHLVQHGGVDRAGPRRPEHGPGPAVRDHERGPVGVACAARPAARTPPPGPGRRANSSPRSAETSCRSDMVSAPTERWIGPICSGWSRWSTSRASPWSQGEPPSAAPGRAAPAAAGGRRRSGGARRRSAPGSRPARRRSRRASPCR